MSLEKKIFTVALAQYIFFNFHLPLFPPEVANKKLKIFNFLQNCPCHFFFFNQSNHEILLSFPDQSMVVFFQYIIYSCFFCLFTFQKCKCKSKSFIFHRKTFLSKDIFQQVYIRLYDCFFINSFTIETCTFCFCSLISEFLKEMTGYRRLNGVFVDF